MMLSRHPLIMWLLLDQVEVLAIEDGHWSSSYTPWQTLTSWIGCGNDLRRSSHDICEFQCLNGESQRLTISLLLRQFRDLEYELTRWWSTLSPLYNAHMLECPLHCSDAGQTSDLWFLVGYSGAPATHLLATPAPFQRPIADCLQKMASPSHYEHNKLSQRA